MGGRTFGFLHFWGLELALVSLVLITLLPVAFGERPTARVPLAAVMQTPPMISWPPELMSGVLSDEPRVLTPVSLAPDIRVYRGKQYRFAKTLSLRVTAYAPDPRCTFPYDGTTTASGLPVTTNGGHLVASDSAVIPLHWLVIVPGYDGGRAVPVLDRGGAIKGQRLDVLLPTFDQAKNWGVRTLDVRVYRPASKDF